MKILEKVKPGRFLVKMPGGFVESDDERSREKGESVEGRVLFKFRWQLTFEASLLPANSLSSST
jgi:hypothetical protein